MKKALSLLLALALLSGTAWAATYDVSYPVTGGNLHFNSATGTIVGNDTNAAELVIPGAINGVPVTTIGDSAFVGRSNLTGVTIPDSVTAIEYGAFMFCSNLTSVSIPGSVTSIGDYAFSHTGLTSLTIPDSVTSIGSMAFQGCNITNVTVPSSVASLGEGAFWVCRNLTSATILCDIATIEAYTFGTCDSLTSVYIPASVTSIEHHAFMLTPLEDIYYGGSESQWRQIAIDTLEDGNASLYKATVHYNSAPLAKPTDPVTPTGDGLEMFIDFDSERLWDGGLTYAYTLTNNSAEDVEGYYVFLATDTNEYYTTMVFYANEHHDDITTSENYYVPSLMFPLDVSLKPGESLQGKVHCTLYYLNPDMRMIIIQFDSLSEREAFLADPRLREDYEGTEYVTWVVDDADFLRGVLGLEIGTVYDTRHYY